MHVQHKNMGIVIMYVYYHGASCQMREGSGKKDRFKEAEGEGWMRIEKITLNEERNVTLTAYLQGVEGEFWYVPRRPAILVIPGGGYQFCSDREAEPVALPYLKAGYQAFILRYSIGEDAVWPNPLDDYDQAMELIRSRAEEWRIYEDKIAVIGFSAGGHLAAAAATMAKNRPNAAILGYAVAGEDVKACSKTAPDTISAVDRNTCPCFLFSSRTDNVVPVANSVRFMQALVDHDIAFESHIYAYGPHGFSTADSSIQHKDTVMCPRTADWVEDSIGWLKDVLGDFGTEGMTEPVCKWHLTDDGEPYLSVDCTLGCLLGNEEARKVLEPLLTAKKQEFEAETDTSTDPDTLPRNMRLRDILGYVRTPAEVVAGLQEKLSGIPNNQ